MTALAKWRTAALYAIAVLVAAGSLAAFAESYRGLYDWSREHDLSGFWAAAWPLQLDVFIAIGELALFVALVDAWSRRSRAAAWAVTIIGAAVSVAGNVGHVSGHDIASRVSAGVPPVAAACALFVALGVLKHVTAAARSAPVVQPETVRAPVAETVAQPSQRDTPATEDATPPAAPVRQSAAAPVRQVQHLSDEDKRAEASRLIAANPRIGATELARTVGVHRSTADRWIKAETRPRLVAKEG